MYVCSAGGSDVSNGIRIRIQSEQSGPEQSLECAQHLAFTPFARVGSVFGGTIT